MKSNNILIINSLINILLFFGPREPPGSTPGAPRDPPAHPTGDRSQRVLLGVLLQLRRREKEARGGNQERPEVDAPSLSRFASRPKQSAMRETGLEHLAVRI